MRAIPIYLHDGRPVGRVVDDNYHTTRRCSVHLLRYPPAWAIDRDILAQLETRGVRRVVIHELEDGSTYEAELSAFTRHGVRIDRGHGEQVALPLAYWRVNGERSEHEREREQRELRSAQLALFGAEVLP